MYMFNILCLLFLAVFSYGFINMGIEWYYVLPGAFFAFAVMSSITQLIFGLSDSLLKKQQNPNE